jgi:hypothetical protein
MKVTMVVDSERLSGVKVNFWTVEDAFSLDFFNCLCMTRTHPLPVIVISLDILGSGHLRGLLDGKSNG